MFISKLIKGAFIFAMALTIGTISVDAAPNDIVYMPDPNLKMCVNQYFGQAGTLNDFTEAQATMLTTIDCRNKNIINLEGLQYFKSLQNPRLYGNLIVNVEPLRNLITLKNLELGNNQIVNMEPLTSLTNVTSVGLNGNKIEKLEPFISGNKASSLNINNNRLTNIDGLVSFKNIVSIDISGNNLTSLPDMSQLTKLTYFSAAMTFLTDISGLSNVSTLIEANIFGNKLEDISPLLGSVNTITKLIAGGNAIIDLSIVSKFVNATSVQIQGQYGSIAKLPIFDGTVTLNNPVKDDIGTPIAPNSISNGGRYENGKIIWDDVVERQQLSFTYDSTLSTGKPAYGSVTILDTAIYALCDLPLDIVIIQDASWSFNGRIGTVKETLNTIINAKKPEDRMMVISYQGREGNKDSTGMTPGVISASEGLNITVQAPLSSDKVVLKNGINQITAKGSTPTASGLKKAFDEYEATKGDITGRQTIFLLVTDGVANVRLDGYLYYDAPQYNLDFLTFGDNTERVQDYKTAIGQTMTVGQEIKDQGYTLITSFLEDKKYLSSSTEYIDNYGVVGPYSSAKLQEMATSPDFFITDSLNEYLFSEKLIDTFNNQTCVVIPEADVQIVANNRTINIGDSFNPMTDVSATENNTINIDPSIEVVYNDVDNTKKGIYSVSYKATNSAAMSAYKTIQVDVLDTVVPVANEAPVINAVDQRILKGTNFDPLNDISATDKEDGEIFNIIIVSNDVNTNTVGFYNIQYKATDSQGKETLKTTQVEVYENTPTPTEPVVVPTEPVVPVVITPEPTKPPVAVEPKPTTPVIIKPVVAPVASPILEEKPTEPTMPPKTETSIKNPVSQPQKNEETNVENILEKEVNEILINTSNGMEIIDVGNANKYIIFSMIFTLFLMLSYAIYYAYTIYRK